MTATLDLTAQVGRTGWARGDDPPRSASTKKPGRADAIQGELGDAALIAMIGAVAGHRPELIRRAVRVHPGGGVYVVLHQVQLDPIAVDWTPTGRTIPLDLSRDLPVLPYKGETNTAYADTAYSGALWPALLENGFAVLDTNWTASRRLGNPARSYTRLDAGMNVWEAAEALAQLTGARAGVQILRPGTAGLTIRYLLAHRCPVLIQTLPPATAAPGSTDGVYPGHAYEVTSITPTGNLHLHNPWGLLHATIPTATLFTVTGGVIVTLKN